MDVNSLDFESDSNLSLIFKSTFFN